MGFFQNTCKPIGLAGKFTVHMMNCVHGSASRWGFSHIQVMDTAQILDIGCGGGANIAHWLKLCKKGHVTGIDYSQVSVDSSSSKNQRAIAKDRCKVLLGNVLELPFDNETFQMVSAFETIYFWPDIIDSFSQVYRVLKAGGKFMICNELDGSSEKDEKWTNLIQGMRVYKEKELTDLLLTVGFKNLAIEHNSKNWICIIAEK